MSDRITSDASRAADVLRHGGIVGMPTETVYGLAALAHDEAAVARVFAVKGRPRTHPLIVHLPAAAEADRWGRIDDRARALMLARWPGPLTILVPRTLHSPVWVTGGRDTVALRVPDHALALELLSLVDDGIVAPSANRFGKVSPTKAEHVLEDLGVDVDLVLDGGPCGIGLESTIVDCSGEHLQVLRPGAVSAIEIAAVTGLDLVDPTGESRAPGMLLSHYAPRAKVVTVATMEEAREEVAGCEEQGRRAVILHDTDTRLLAMSLYDRLREADANGADVVVAVLPPATGIGVAIRDRLAKASAD